MNERLERVVRTKAEAYAAVRNGYELAQTLLLNGVERVQIIVREDPDPITVKQRNFLNGPVLAQVADQVRVEGQRYVKALWKDFYRELLLPEVWEMQRKPFVRDKHTGQWRPSRRATPVKVRQSTEDLGIKAMSDFIDRLLAHAATEFGVEFHFDIDEREGARYRPPVRRKAPQPEGETA